MPVWKKILFVTVLVTFIGLSLFLTFSQSPEIPSSTEKVKILTKSKASRAGSFTASTEIPIQQRYISTMSVTKREKIPTRQRALLQSATLPL